ncbi:beta/gamma crystallin domain-containing protein [Streptomyces sp. NBC_01750]|uniref:beta/gamma crystallin domain-containing protein n=1 Tax=Streptomyces sp. NBC_01750 TaxID=2975928 RepID=UPI002DDA770D|nr:beta/gamma crystallin domain-containing protein [Streptomyces sp. NBC_01750]WSD37514.1 beta/gamma crystallin domain-containing protein [Streptomyces sp. NBC_01750]
MKDDQVTFYAQLSFAGEAHTYDLGADENLHPGELNDKFKSLKVGQQAKVLAWQHANQTGKYREWNLDQSDITGIGGLSRFKVTRDTTLPIAVRLEDLTGGQNRQYSLKVDSFEVGQILVYSGDLEYGLVGIMPEDGPPVTTAIYVRDEQSGNYVATGSVYFAWNGTTKSVDVADETNFPDNMRYKRDGRNQFIFELTAV